MRTRRSSVETSLNVLLTAAAVIIAGVLVKRELQPPTERSDQPTWHDSWEETFEAGIRVGDHDAVAKLVMFFDLECPACKTFHAVLMDAMRVWAGAVEVSFVHYPLGYHRYAMPAAEAAECAYKVGAFEAFVAAVYAKQDSLGTKPWPSYLEGSEVDYDRFARCMDDSGALVGRIEAGRRAGARTGITGTPAVMVNGWLLPRTPTKDQLLMLFEAVESGIITPDSRPSRVAGLLQLSDRPAGS